MRTSQNGFTIVELLIALGIALIIVLGLYAFLVDTQRSYLNVASNDQNNRRSKNAATVTQNFLQQAGFVNYLNLYKGKGLDNGDSSVCNGKWTYLCIVNKGAQQSDVYIRYYGSSNSDSYPQQNFQALQSLKNSGGDPDEPDKRMYDCSGRFIGNEHIVTERLFLDGSSLNCQIVEDRCPGGTCTELTGNTYLIERNIERFVAFGAECEDVNAAVNSGNTVITRRKCTVKAPSKISDWNLVGAVKFVLVQAEESGQKVIKPSEGEKFELSDIPGAEMIYQAPADSKVRKMLGGTVYLRNYLRNK
ncbi:MAG: prepilin-type N-terminal cleavage/methylation domain-containing protein [Succinivibrionaceae bacterium]|nr:prepilin-type N-terminal cleavage/methylation domain-containing protein [Succinivibrionaceae bacterium]